MIKQEITGSYRYFNAKDDSFIFFRTIRSSVGEPDARSVRKFFTESIASGQMRYPSSYIPTFALP